MFLVFGIMGYANAAALNWNADQTIDLSNPDINLIIKSGSEATSLVVGTGNLQVVVPGGAVFTVTSASRNLNVVGEPTSQVSTICEGTTVTVVISGSSNGETMTITPTSDNCSVRSGGGGGGNKTFKKIIPTILPSNITSSGCLPGFLFNTMNGLPCANTSISSGVYNFGTGVVKLGSMGENCKAWQMFFNEKAGAHLVVDGICGPLTMAVAKNWQASMGLVVDGLLGPLSRAKANAQ